MTSDLPTCDPNAGLRLERHGPLATLIIDRPQFHNTLTVPLADELARTVQTLSSGDVPRALTIRGAGSKAFSAGFDIGAIAGTTDVAADGSVATDRQLDTAFRALEEAPFPVVAAVRGHCIGGGFELALACDLRIAAEDAQFRMPPARLGWVYGLPNLARFVSVMGASRASYVFLAGETLSARTALDWGIVHEVVPAADLDARLAELTSRLAAAAPIALAGLKQGIAALSTAAVLPEDVERHAAWRRRAFASSDLLEGRAAFLERRKPSFVGR